MSDSNYYSTYRVQAQKEEASINDAVASRSKSDEYLDVEVNINSTIGVEKESSIKTVYAGKVVIQRWHLLLLVVFTACSIATSLSLLVFGSSRISTVVSEYDKFKTENTELREVVKDLQFKLEATDTRALLSQVN